MGRLVMDRWEGAVMAVGREKGVRGNPDGSPQRDENGNPIEVDLWVLQFTIDFPGERRVMSVPIEDEARLALIKQLTGGVIVTPGNGMPPHLPFGSGV